MPAADDRARPAARRLTITQVAAQLSVDPDTLRYYERHGVVPPAPRDGAGRRSYAEADVHLLEVLMHLRSTGMPLARIAEFTHHVASDPDGVPERLALLQEHRRHAQQQLDAWSRSMSVIDGKIRDYRRRLRAERATGAPEP